MTTKNPINCVKTQNSSETKIILELRYVFLDKKKHINITPLII